MDSHQNLEDLVEDVPKTLCNTVFLDHPYYLAGLERAGLNEKVREFHRGFCVTRGRLEKCYRERQVSPK